MVSQEFQGEFIRENVVRNAALYRAIKLICNRVIHGFESVCLYD
jgi:hypothetical protein